jgi:hypothetical protein
VVQAKCSQRISSSREMDSLIRTSWS